MAEEKPAAPTHDAQAVPGGDESATGGLGAQVTPGLLPGREPFRSMIRWLGIAEQTISIVLLLVILALVLMQIVQRFLPSGFAWTGEMARFAMVWITFVMSGYLLGQDAHIAIKVVDYFLPDRALGLVKLAGHALITITCGVMLYGVFDFMTKDRGQVTAAAGVPLTLIYTVVAFGFASTALRGILAIVLVDLAEIRGEPRTPS